MDRLLGPRIATAGRVTAGLLVLCLLAGGPALAAGSVAAGKARAITCAACHGPDGNSANPQWPNLAGQHASYLVQALQAFKAGTRQNVLMSPQAASLSDQDIENLAAYFAAQARRPGTADPDLAATGERLYRGGDLEKGVSACIACHGPEGHGNAPAAYPALAGQHAVYTAAQLRAFRASERKSDRNQMMRNIAARLSDEEIEAVAAYIQGLR